MSEPVDWSGPTPRSPRYDDIYFSPLDGLAETQAVFLKGCGMPEVWADQRRFCVGELGFGTGLNILALIDLWRRTRPRSDAVLQIFSVEAFPISAADAEKALAAWPELSDLAQTLIAHWPGGRRGFHRVEWPSCGVILDLAILEVETALAAWSGSADAWFLDGFAPSKNPEMWRGAVLDLIAERSNPGACAATFSVAGLVRRGLAAAGFQVARAPGFGKKKQRLEARLPLSAPPSAGRRRERRLRVGVIGAGIAGASLHRAFVRQGCDVSVFDQDGPGWGGSGNPAALVAPRLDAGLGPGAELFAQAFVRAVQLYASEIPEAVIDRGALQLALYPRDAARFDKIASWDGFDPGAAAVLDPEAAGKLIHESQAALGVRLKDALVVEPSLILKSWLAADWVKVKVAGMLRRAESIELIDCEDRSAGQFDVVCLAAGPASINLAPGLPLRPVRGQASFTDAVTLSGQAATFTGYVLPTRAGVLFGATHDRDDWSVEIRPSDDRRNLKTLADGRPALAALIGDRRLSARASLRAMSADHLPLAGAVVGDPGVFVLSGMGGRGFTLAPLLAEAVAAEALGAPSPLPGALAKLIHPRRFQDR